MSKEKVERRLLFMVTIQTDIATMKLRSYWIQIRLDEQ